MSLVARWFFGIFHLSAISSLILTEPPTHNNLPPDETITKLTGHHFPSLKAEASRASCQKLNKPDK